MASHFCTVCTSFDFEPYSVPRFISSTIQDLRFERLVSRQQVKHEIDHNLKALGQLPMVQVITKCLESRVSY